MNLRVFASSLFLLFAISPTSADDWKPEEGFSSLFNGSDLTGWCFKAKTGEVTEKFDGKAATTDGRYSAKDGVLSVNPPVGVPRLVAQIWTQKEFPTNFVLKIEFRAADRRERAPILAEQRRGDEGVIGSGHERAVAGQEFGAGALLRVAPHLRAGALGLHGIHSAPHWRVT